MGGVSGENLIKKNIENDLDNDDDVWGSTIEVKFM